MHTILPVRTVSIPSCYVERSIRRDGTYLSLEYSTKLKSDPTGPWTDRVDWVSSALSDAMLALCNSVMDARTKWMSTTLPQGQDPEYLSTITSSAENARHILPQAQPFPKRGLYNFIQRDSDNTNFGSTSATRVHGQNFRFSTACCLLYSHIISATALWTSIYVSSRQKLARRSCTKGFMWNSAIYTPSPSQRQLRSHNS